MVNLGFESNAQETNILADSDFQYNAALGITKRNFKFFRIYLIIPNKTYNKLN